MADGDQNPPRPIIARLLGPAELRLGDRLLTDADWPRRSAHLLLLLLVTPGHALPRDRAVDLLWPEASPGTAANLLAIALNRLRLALEPGLAAGHRSGYIETAAGIIRLHLPPGSTVDADAFEAALLDVRRLPVEDRREPLRSALAAYAGDLVADEPDLAWLLPRREQLAALRRAGAVELAALDHDSSGPPPQAASTWREGRVPIPPTRLIGRRRELDEVSGALLGGRSRLVTLVGAGGIGKTHLAQEAARGLEGDYADGAVWVPLAALRDPGLVPTELARALGVADDGARPVEDALADAVAGRAVLLVVDNLEQVVIGAPVLARLLAVSPRSAVLATSRQRLHLPGEHVVELPPLPAATDGVALFLARADQAGVPLPASQLPAVAEICRRLDGLPLAIELAAAAARHLTVQQILDRLGQRLDLLVDGPRDVDPRQRTMRATIAWGDDLLTPAQRACFRRLGVFAGAPRDLIDRVVSVGPIADPPPAADAAAVDQALAALVDAHLIRRDDTGSVPRYLLLETVRAFAIERLADAGELPAASAAHVAAFTDLAARAGERLSGPDSIAWLDRLEDEHDNLRSAAAWAVEHGDPADVLRIAAGTMLFFSARGHRLEWRERIDHALALAEGIDPLLEAAALRAAGLLLEDLRDYAAAGHHYATALAALPGEPAGARLRCQLLSGLGILAVLQSDYPAARAHYGEALRVATAAALPRDVLAVEFHLGRVAMDEGDLDEADRCFGSVLAAIDDPHLRWRLLQNIAMLAFVREDYPRLRTVVLESLPLARRTGDLTSIAVLLMGLANAAVGLGESGGTAVAEEALARCVALSDPYLEVAARQTHAAALRHDGDLPAATATLARALLLLRHRGVPITSAEILEELVPVLVGLGRVETAARLVGACDRARADQGYPRFHRRRRVFETSLAALTAAMPDPARALAIASGAALTLDAAVDLALSACHDLAPAPPV